jgi:hypothetical protein
MEIRCCRTKGLVNMLNLVRSQAETKKSGIPKRQSALRAKNLIQAKMLSARTRRIREWRDVKTRQLGLEMPEMAAAAAPERPADTGSKIALKYIRAHGGVPEIRTAAASISERLQRARRASFASKTTAWRSNSARSAFNTKAGCGVSTISSQ